MGTNPWTYILLFTVIVAGGALLVGVVFSLLMGFLGGSVARKTQEKYAGKIEALLPGTNCGACGYESCAAYADAVLHVMAEEDLCPHRDQETAKKMEEIRVQLQTLMEDPTPPKEQEEKRSVWNKKI